MISRALSTLLPAFATLWVVLSTLSGCTSLSELDALCYQGDAEACLKAIKIEKRLATQALRNKTPNCPEGYVAYRAGNFGDWSCVERNAMLEAMGL